MSALQAIVQIEKEIQSIPARELSFQIYEDGDSEESRIRQLIENHVREFPEVLRNRVWAEFDGNGPITELLNDDQVTEIIINGSSSIHYEKNGQLHSWPDRFASALSYSHFITRLCHQARAHFTLDRPMADGRWNDFRVHIASEELTRSEVVVSLRRHPTNPWTLEKLQEVGWASATSLSLIKEMISSKENFLVVGATGSGKTSFLNACLQQVPSHDRVIIIEDTQELEIPNSLSTRLLARKDAQGTLSAIDQMELLRQALRMRPDRLVMGEVRGSEAKDLLMVLSTGHEGSFATLHAQNPQQALLRLEMLIQLGAPFWSIEAIRNLIFLSLQKIIVVGRAPGGHRELKGIYRLSSRESSGILVERLT